MQTTARRDRLVVGLSLLALAAALATALVGFVLAEVYEPGVSPRLLRELQPAEPRGSAWSDWHVRLSLLFLAASTALSVTLAWFVYRARLPGARSALLLASSGLAMVAAVLTMATRSLIEWHQVALWSVSNDVDATGYLLAAFDDDVRFVLIDGREVSTGEYALALLAHLGAPVVGTVALLLATVALVQVTRARPAPPSAMETPASGDVSVP
jgi:hypothetical protein